VFHNNAWKTATQVVTERTMTASVAEVFPCSSGSKHQKMELNPTVDETPIQQVSYQVHVSVSCAWLKTAVWLKIFDVLDFQN